MAPDVVPEILRTWDLEVEGEYPPSWAWVARVRLTDGTAAVLKVVRDDEDPQARREAAALEHFGGEAAARVLAHDPQRGALLLECLRPGTPLTELAARDDDAATLAAADVMRRLRRPAPADGPFPDAAAYGDALHGPAAAVLASALVAGARAEYADLCASAAAPVLVHGDLHHLNVLRAGEGWKAIDPKGVLAEPAYETGALLRNPLGAPLDRPRLERRIALLAEALDLDAARIRAWARAQAVLAAVWCVEDGEDPAWFTHCAGLLSD
jgi:streptomycin 6-kinase